MNNQSPLFEQGLLYFCLNPPAVFTPYKIQLKNRIIINHIDVNVVEVIPADPINAIVISAGIHGDETIPLELTDAILRAIVQQEIMPNAHLLFIIAHPNAILCHQRFIDENLNRLFLEQHISLLSDDNNRLTQERKIAAALQGYVADFYLTTPVKIAPWHLDLHSAIRQSLEPTFAVIPSAVNEEAKHKVQQFCQHGQINATLQSLSPSSTFSWWSAHYFSALAVTIELGQVAPLFSNNMSEYLGIKHAIFCLITGHPLPPIKQEHRFTAYRVSRTLIKQDASFAFSFDASAPNFTFFAQGEVIATENNASILALDKGETIVFANASVPIGQRTALLLQKITP